MFKILSAWARELELQLGDGALALPKIGIRGA